MTPEKLLRHLQNSIVVSVDLPHTDRAHAPRWHAARDALRHIRGSAFTLIVN
ncbi:hypothetical protein ALP40_00260 [Pseudomonas viridiflava]|uniref:Uncharacterized protein n=1 Tax=Pseudomonas viridiflava TaxID=33069 RepID=A0A3M5NVS5_PSEVI|nr:hypothetical protein ALP40_00260 [Pseudomonas viridiflava]